jgi:tetratricopeptide (TPR) repeat protein
MKNFKKAILFICLVSFGYSLSSDAQTSRNKKVVRREKKVNQVKRSKQVSRPATRQTPSRVANSGLKRQLYQALQLSQSGQYQQAAIQLFNLARRPELQNERAQIKYILGLMLLEMKLNQVAAFQFVDVIRSKNPKYTKLAIEKLASVADELGDDTLINYAMSRVNLSDVPESNRDMIQFRIGEIKMRAKRFEEAIRSFSLIGLGSRYYSQALHKKGLAYLELGNPDAAIKVFQTMFSARRKASVTDTNRVAAQLALARALYQKQDWDASVAAYSEIPRDHFLWHEALYEQTWAMLRAARFRSALSNFQSLQSPFYEDDYNPESLILRSIVYLYICKYDEMEKVLSLFEKTYGPARSQISVFLTNHSNPLTYYMEVEKWQSIKKSTAENRPALRVPYAVANNISNLGAVKRSLNYLKRLNAEKKSIDTNQGLRNTGIGRYALKVINNRSHNTKISIGEIAKVEMTNMKNELKDYAEQASFVRYEMISAQKEVVKKKISGSDLPEARIDDNRSRSFYVQNGYQYYPFEDEYWLDELGNYHFLGKSSCE